VEVEKKIEGIEEDHEYYQDLEIRKKKKIRKSN
jgi:hypothetical protein